jgi:hypothetical protein
MKREELGKRLEKRDIPRKWYSLYGYSEEAFCIEKLSENEWIFYYGERDLKEPLTRFDNEEDACAEMWSVMLKKMDRVMRLLSEKKKKAAEA